VSAGKCMKLCGTGRLRRLLSLTVLLALQLPVQFLGSADSGIGLPSIGEWAKGQKAKSDKSRVRTKNQMETLMATMDAMKVNAEFNKKIAEAQDDGERMKLQHEMEEASQNTMLRVIWSVTVVDITATIHEACQMVFFDQSVDKETHERRAHAVKNLGQIFLACPEPSLPEGGKKTGKCSAVCKEMP
jgi:X-domain of DnaJ-containing